MTEPHMLPARRRDRLYTAITLTLGVLLLPAAFLRHPGRTRELACAWALRLRFPAEDLTGLSPGTRTALTAARTEAFWRDHQLIGVTSGHRDAATQRQLFLSEVQRSGSLEAARTWVLPPSESRHVQGIALDVRPVGDVAEILDCSPRTVTKHLEQIYQKLDVENRTAAAMRAVHVLGS